LALHIDGDVKGALAYFNLAVTEDLGDFMAEVLLLSGQAKEALEDIPGAIDSYRRAIEFPKTESTGAAHYHLGIALKRENKDIADIKSHIELSLNLGVDPTAEAIEILGEDHISVMRGVNRMEWKQYKESTEPTGNSGRGGIMGGTKSVSSSESIFSQQKSNDNIQSSGGGKQSETLSILEQGAVSYDGKTPSGDEILNGVEKTSASAARQQSSARNKAQKT